jgi:hypothetical protein
MLSNRSASAPFAIKSGMVCNNDGSIADSLLCGWIYEMWAKGGKIAFRSDRAAMAAANGFLLYESASMESVRQMAVSLRATGMVLKLAVLCEGSRIAAEERQHVCDQFGSSLLLMRLCGMMGVELVPPI